MSGWVAFPIFCACVVALLFMTAHEWCPGTSFMDAPICTGVQP